MRGTRRQFDMTTVNGQDAAAQIGQGAIADRTAEHLSSLAETSDIPLTAISEPRPGLAAAPGLTAYPRLWLLEPSLGCVARRRSWWRARPISAGIMATNIRSSDASAPRCNSCETKSRARSGEVAPPHSRW